MNTYLFYGKNGKNAGRKITVLLLFVFSSLFFFSCTKDESDTPKAIEDLIEKTKTENPDCVCDPSIDLYRWRNKSIYVLAAKGPLCNSIPLFYTSSGQAFSLDEGYSYAAFLQEGLFVKNVWTCK